MKLQKQITILFFLPIGIILIIAACISVIAYLKWESILNTLSNQLYEYEKQQRLSITAPLSNRLQQLFQNLVIQGSAIQNFNLHTRDNFVNKNTNFVPPLTSLEMLYIRNESQQILDLYSKSHQYVETWYQKNTSNFNMLPAQSQQRLMNYTQLGVLQHSVITAQNFVYNDIIVSEIDFGFVQDGVIYTSPTSNSSLKSVAMPIVSGIPNLKGRELSNNQPTANFTHNINQKISPYHSNSNNSYSWCAPGTFGTYDPRCRQWMYELDSNSVQGVVAIQPQISFQYTPPQYTLQLSYKTSFADTGYYCASRQLITIANLQQRLAEYANTYDFVLFHATSQVLAYFNGIENDSSTQTPTLYNTPLFGLNQAQQSQYVALFPQSLFTYTYQVGALNSSTQSQLLSMTNVDIDSTTIIEYGQGDSEILSIAQPIRVYQNIQNYQSIDNYYVLVDTISRRVLVESLDGVRSKTRTYNAIIVGVISVLVVLALLWAFTFARSFASNQDQTLSQMAKLLRLIDATYYCKSRANNEEQQYQKQESPCHQNVFTQARSRQTKILSPNQKQVFTNVETQEPTRSRLGSISIIANEEQVENKLNQVLDNIVSSHEMRILCDSFAYLFQLLKFANLEYWRGEVDLSLLRLCEAHQVRGYKEAISCYDESLEHLEAIAGQKEQLKNIYEKNVTELEKKQEICSKKFEDIEQANSQAGLVSQKTRRIRSQSNFASEINNNELSQIFAVQKFERLISRTIACIEEACSLHKKLSPATVNELIQQIVVLENFSQEYLTICQCRFLQMHYLRVLVMSRAEILDATEIQDQLAKYYFAVKQRNRQISSYERVPTISMHLSDQMQSQSEFRRFPSYLMISQRMAGLGPQEQQKSFIFCRQRKRNCKSTYYHFDQEIHLQKIHFLLAYTRFREGKHSRAAQIIACSFESLKVIDIYTTSLMKNLLQEIFKANQIPYSLSMQKRHPERVLLAFDQTHRLSPPTAIQVCSTIFKLLTSSYQLFSAEPCKTLVQMIFCKNLKGKQQFNRLTQFMPCNKLLQLWVLLRLKLQYKLEQQFQNQTGKQNTSPSVLLRLVQNLVKEGQKNKFQSDNSGDYKIIILFVGQHLLLRKKMFDTLEKILHQHNTCLITVSERQDEELSDHNDRDIQRQSNLSYLHQLQGVEELLEELPRLLQPIPEASSRSQHSILIQQF